MSVENTQDFQALKNLLEIIQYKEGGISYGNY